MYIASVFFVLHAMPTSLPVGPWHPDVALDNASATPSEESPRTHRPGPGPPSPSPVAAPRPLPTTWQLAKDLTRVLLLLGLTLVVARVVGALERVVQGQQRSLAEYREGLLAASQDAGDGLVQLTNATSDTGAAPRRLPSYPSYDDSVGTRA